MDYAWHSTTLSLDAPCSQAFLIDACRNCAPDEPCQLDFQENASDEHLALENWFWVNYNELTTSSLEIMVSKGNHPQMALIQVSELF